MVEVLDHGVQKKTVVMVIAEFQLERAWNSLIWKEKLSLLTSVIGGLTSLSDLSMKTLKVSSVSPVFV